MVLGHELERAAEVPESRRWPVGDDLVSACLLARAITVSLVLMSPSTEMQLNECPRLAQRAPQRSGVMAMSVAMKHSMVAMFG